MNTVTLQHESLRAEEVSDFSGVVARQALRILDAVAKSNPKATHTALGFCRELRVLSAQRDRDCALALLGYRAQIIYLAAPQGTEVRRSAALAAFHAVAAWCLASRAAVRYAADAHDASTLACMRDAWDALERSAGCAKAATKRAAGSLLGAPPTVLTVFRRRPAPEGVAS